MNPFWTLSRKSFRPESIQRFSGPVCAAGPDPKRIFTVSDILTAQVMSSIWAE
jgi:hypothetical protein